jgi:hypothetical protein
MAPGYKARLPVVLVVWGGRPALTGWIRSSRKEPCMIARRLLTSILNDEALTRGLGDPEARVLVEWLVDRADEFAGSETADDQVASQISRLCLRGRAISRFVRLWCHAEARGAALQLACTERFTWPLPCTSVNPCELMQGILDWEARNPPACLKAC